MESIALAGLTTVNCRLKVDCIRGRYVMKSLMILRNAAKVKLY